MHFGDVTIVAPTENPPGVWDVNYKGVWHLKEDPAAPAPEFLDSSPNTNDGTAVNLFTGDQVPGKINGSLDFDGSNGRHVDVADHPSLRLPGDMTVSAWVHSTDMGPDARLVVAKWIDGGHKNYWFGRFYSLDFGFHIDADNEVVDIPLGLVHDGAWHYVVGVADAANSLLRLYLDGIEMNTSPYDGVSETGNSPLYIGESPDFPTQEWDGGIDEVRVSDRARSADWIQTEYNNQVSSHPFFKPTFNPRSIGTDNTDLHTGGTVTVSAGSNTVTFSNATTAFDVVGAVGLGDKLDIEGELFYIIRRVTNTDFIVDHAAATDHVAAAAYTVTRAYNTINGWEIDREGDLLIANRLEMGVAYKDGAFTENVVIDGSVTDADRFMWLTVGAGQRHGGTEALVPTDSVVLNPSVAGHAISVQDDFTRIEWLEVTDWLGDKAAGVHIDADGTTYSRMIVHGGVETTDDESDGFYLQPASGDWAATVRNSMVYQVPRAGIHLRNSSGFASLVYTIENVTLYDCGSVAAMPAASSGGITVEENFPNNSTVHAVNVISVNNVGVDFNISFGTPSWGSSDYNLSSDGSAPGGTTFVSDAATEFVSTVPVDMHLSGIAVATDKGTDLSGAFCCDIDYETRSSVWDIGADEFAGTTAVELQSFSAVGFDGEVLVKWETASEIDNLGFFLYRSESLEGPYVRVNATAIPGLGSSPVGAKYSYRDQDVVNGKTYYYELEDFEASGRRERHGPVWARPDVGLTSETPPAGGESSSGSSSSITVGETGSTLREVGRGRGYVELELVTRGFTALPLADGSTALSVEGFSEEWEAGRPAVPVKRVWIEALAGKEVRIGSVRARDVTSFSLRPAAADAPAILVESGGTVRAGRKPRQSRRNRLSRVETDGKGGVYPAESARVVSVGFDGEEKKALLELAPMQWNGSTGQLVLAQRLVVRVEFDGAVAYERSLGGSRGRRYRGRPAPELPESKVVARLSTTQSGLYGVSYESVFGSRGSRGQGVSTSELRLSRQGESVAYHLEPSGSVFGRGSVLYFVSEGAAINPYGLEAVVELEVGVSGDVMGEDATVPSGGGMSHYLHREESEENHFYATSFATPLWLWETLLSGMSGSYGFEVSELSLTPASGEVEVRLKGVSRVEEFYPPRVRLSINGVVLAEEEWGSEELYRMRAEVPSGVLQSGTNTLLVENVSTSDYTAVMLDRFAVSYARRVVAESGVLRGKWSDSGRAEVTGVEGGSFVVDVTEPKPLWLTETVPVVGGMAFHATSQREYLVVSPESVLSPEIHRSSSSQLKHTSQQADYLVLAPKEFLRASIPLLRLRRSQGLRSRAVSLEEVYAEFGHGESSPEAIRDFLAYAYHEWASPSIRYVVLLGDGSYDFKDYLGTGVVNHVPPRLEKTSFMWTSSDSWYGRVNGEDVLADISIGRLPASTVEEAHGMVKKIVAYETSGQSLEGSVVLVTDDPDPGGDFEGDAEELAGGILLSRSPRKIYLGDLGVSSTKSAIVQAFDEGTSLMSYIGHGSITFWAQENVFDGESIEGLRPQQEQPLVLTMNCLNGFFHYPYLDALAEELILAEDKGAVAVVSPSGLSLNGPAHRFHRALLEELTSGDHATLGDAMLAAQSTYADKGEFLELLTIFHVFGDPALKLQR
jgi:hypothetical protein